jgi:hypothetical protein
MKYYSALQTKEILTPAIYIARINFENIMPGENKARDKKINIV